MNPLDTALADLKTEIDDTVRIEAAAGAKIVELENRHSGPTIAIINASTVVTDDEARKAVAALQIQVSRDFAAAWGIDATLFFVPKGDGSAGSGLGPQPTTGAWQLVILDNSDQADALGYHDITADGLPIGKIFAKSDIEAGTSWTVTASHELLEILADPDINLTCFREDIGQLWAYEVGDAVEADSLGYLIDGVLVSDFVFPSWFEGFRKSGTRFDQQNKVTAPFQLLPGGYIGYYQIKSGAGWQQLTADKSPATARKARAPIGSRRDRRRTPRSQWMVSTR